MTLIACTINSVENIPVVKGDLLISRYQAKETVRIPAVSGAIDKYLKPNVIYRPHSLIQKIYIFKENVCLAMAGNKKQMSSFLEDFGIYCRSLDTVNAEKIHAFLDNYSFKGVMSDSTFLILVSELLLDGSPHLSVVTFPENQNGSGGWKTFNTSLFNQVYACGTGAGVYEMLMKHLNNTSGEKFHNPIWNAISDNVLALVQFMAIEMITLDFTVSKLWGGGFEMIFYNGKTFEKLSKIAYVLHLGKFAYDGEIGYPAPKMVLYSNYIDEDLILTAIHLKAGKKNDEGEFIRMVSQKDEYTVHVFTVSGLLQSESSIELEKVDLSFETTKVAVGYAILNQDNRTTTLPYFSNENPNFRVKYSYENELEIFIPKVTLESLREEAKKSHTIK